MKIIKLIGGILILAVGVILFIQDKRKSKNDTSDNINEEWMNKSVTFRSYLFDLVLILIGLWLIFSNYYSSKPQVLDNGKVIVWPK